MKPEVLVEYYLGARMLLTAHRTAAGCGDVLADASGRPFAQGLLSNAPNPNVASSS